MREVPFSRQNRRLSAEAVLGERRRGKGGAVRNVPDRQTQGPTLRPALARRNMGRDPTQSVEGVAREVGLSARWRGETWAEIAAGLGYFDQAHRIGAFRWATGDTPEAFFDAARRRKFSALNAAMGVSDFSYSHCL